MKFYLVIVKVTVMKVMTDLDYKSVLVFMGTFVLLWALVAWSSDSSES